MIPVMGHRRNTYLYFFRSTIIPGQLPPKRLKGSCWYRVLILLLKKQPCTTCPRNPAHSEEISVFTCLICKREYSEAPCSDIPLLG